MEQSARMTLVLGGARSGKSEVAERRAASGPPPVTYVATGLLPRGDSEVERAWAARLAAHRERRPPSWSTVEVLPGASLGAILREVESTVLVDSLGTWVAGLGRFGRRQGDDNVAALLAALSERHRDGRRTIAVSDEVGLGVHPSTPLGNDFRDALGALNRSVGDLADEVLLVVAGRVLALPGTLA